MRIAVWLMALLVAGPCAAAQPVIKAGDTLQIGDVTYRLAGLDAPELDQPCVDEHADPWTCGLSARDGLARLVGGREVRCEDLGEDRIDRGRRLGLCRVTGEALSLNQAMLRAGLAISVDPMARADFAADEAEARAGKQGLWAGCFVAPADFRGKVVTAALQGASCRSDKDRELRAALFPAELAMPPGCNIRAKIVRRAKVTGHVGVYHTLQCKNYAVQPAPDRWFCSEDDARAAGYRKAFNCRAGSAGR